MLLVGVFAGAAEVLRTVYGEVVEIPTLATSLPAFDLAVDGLVVLVEVVAEALGGGTHHLALQALRIVPGAMQFLPVHYY